MVITNKRTFGFVRIGGSCDPESGVLLQGRRDRATHYTSSWESIDGGAEVGAEGLAEGDREEHCHPFFWRKVTVRGAIGS